MRKRRPSDKTQQVIDLPTRRSHISIPDRPSTVQFTLFECHHFFFDLLVTCVGRHFSRVVINLLRFLYSSKSIRAWSLGGSTYLRLVSRRLLFISPGSLKASASHSHYSTIFTSITKSANSPSLLLPQPSVPRSSRSDKLEHCNALAQNSGPGGQFVLKEHNSAPVRSFTPSKLHIEYFTLVEAIGSFNFVLSAQARDLKSPKLNLHHRLLSTSS